MRLSGRRRTDVILLRRRLLVATSEPVRTYRSRVAALDVHSGVVEQPVVLATEEIRPTCTRTQQSWISVRHEIKFARELAMYREHAPLPSVVRWYWWRKDITQVTGWSGHSCRSRVSPGSGPHKNLVVAGSTARTPCTKISLERKQPIVLRTIFRAYEYLTKPTPGAALCMSFVSPGPTVGAHSAPPGPRMVGRWRSPPQEPHRVGPWSLLRAWPCPKTPAMFLL